ncbi:MAG: hypothetical protein E6G71_04650 [Alphaproteobacteria bacterium]|nr:MAG: hypothetical protein E6G71_04650 [Alphaproteobacteria bacterium]
MAGGNISSEKIDLLVYGPNKPIVDNGFSDQFVLHAFETTADLERLMPAVAEKIRGAAVTYNSVRGDSKTLARFPKLEIVSSFGVGYDHIDANYAREHNIVVTNTPDVLTEEVADIALGLLIATLREFIKADRYLRSGLWMTQNFPLSVGSLRDRKVGMVGMGRIGQAIARRLDASRVPVVYHSRKVADGVSYKHYPDLIEMAKAVDTLIVIIPGGAATAYNSVRGDSKTLARFPKLEIVSSFGVGYDHIDANYAREHNIVVTNTPDVLTEEVADIALGLLIATLREFIKADRYLRSGLWMTQNFPLSVGSLRDRKVGMVGMGRIGQAIARRLDASRVPVVYHSRKVADGVSYKHYPDLIEMAKAVDTLIVIIPGGAATAKMINADVMKALGPRGVIINVARGSVVDEPALIAALKSGTILAAGLDVFANEPNVPDELKTMQNVVLLPHVGSASVVTRNAMDQLVVDNLKAWFAGKPPLTPVPETPVKGR